MKAIAFYLLTAVITLGGMILTSKEAGWPSEAERKNIVARSIRSAVGATLALFGLGLAMAYRTSPGSFFDTLGFLPALRAFLLIVLPLFLVMLAGSYIQYAIWGKTQSIMTERLRKIVGGKARPKT